MGQQFNKDELSDIFIAIVSVLSLVDKETRPLDPTVVKFKGRLSKILSRFTIKRVKNGKYSKRKPRPRKAPKKGR